ncbi:MAG: restriction endonuclease subunit S [Chitinophagaceae bacterium]|nr:restriction endonuclease subunit S [Chitinophagaceae bacterium]
MGTLGKFSKGKGIAKSDLVEQGIPCVLYGELYTTHNTVIKRLRSCINRQTAVSSQRVFQNDILFAGSGETPEEIGKAAVFLGTDEVYVGGDIIIFSPTGCDSRFLAYLLNSYIVQRQTYSMAQGYSVVHIYSYHLSSLHIPLPPLPEQKKIAEILSTWDEAIEKLDQLIEKKKLLKKGLMKQLLTGKKRFPGFVEEWKEVRLGDVVYLRHGYQFRNFDFTESGIPIIKIGNVVGPNLDLSDVSYIATDRLAEFSSIVLRDGDILMSLTGNIGRVVQVSGLTQPVLQNYRVGHFSPTDDRILKPYLKFLLESDEVLNQISSLSNQSAQANFGKQDMDKIVVRLPSIAEQRKVAELLSCCDTETTLLNLKRTIQSDQKKGLMQELLTGKIRVKST